MLPITEPGQQHLLNQIVRFSQALHAEGVTVNSSNLIDFCRCLSFIDVRNKNDLYAAAHSTLVSSRAEIPVFAKVFGEFWRLQDEPDEEVVADDKWGEPKPGPDEQEKQFDSRSEGHKDDEQQYDPDSAARSYSQHSMLFKKDFEKMSEEEIEQARLLLKELVALLANFRSRRRSASLRGKEINLRRMLRENALYGRDSIRLLYRKQKIKKSRLLLLCDVSGSMEGYSRFLIQFIYAMRKQLAGLEVAVFSTRMTVITELLSRQSVDQSLQKVLENVHDWAGGTNIGNSLNEFNHRFAYELAHRHSVVIILSDGWDRGNADLMRREIERLYRHTQKLLWLNPLLGSGSYQPLCKGMQTALPFIDYFLPAHNLESLANLIRLLRTIWRK